MQSQLVCSGCRNILLYPRGANNVRCALCSTVSVPPSGMEMAHLICGGCRTLLMYSHGATSVRCSCCQTINLGPAASNQFSQVNCGNCRIMLMYPSGAPSVKCAVCYFVTNVGVPNSRLQSAPQRNNGSTGPGSASSTSSSTPHATQTVVVENPMSVDESGKLVSNVVVGVTTEKKS